MRHLVATFALFVGLMALTYPASAQAGQHGPVIHTPPPHIGPAVHPGGSNPPVRPWTPPAMPPAHNPVYTPPQHSGGNPGYNPGHGGNPGGNPGHGGNPGYNPGHGGYPGGNPGHGVPSTGAVRTPVRGGTQVTLPGGRSVYHPGGFPEARNHGRPPVDARGRFVDCPERGNHHYFYRCPPRCGYYQGFWFGGIYYGGFGFFAVGPWVPTYYLYYPAYGYYYCPSTGIYLFAPPVGYTDTISIVVEETITTWVVDPNTGVQVPVTETIPYTYNATWDAFGGPFGTGAWMYTDCNGVQWCSDGNGTRWYRDAFGVWQRP